MLLIVTSRNKMQPAPLKFFASDNKLVSFLTILTLNLSFSLTMAYFTQTYHRRPYPTISPSAPSNTQFGRTVLICGASTGIGRSIARSFAAAGAAKVILIGRTRATLEDTASVIPTAEARVCDISSTKDVDTLWKSLNEESVHVDTLVLNAAAATIAGSLKSGWKEIWAAFETTVRGNLMMAQGFVGQMGVKQGHVRNIGGYTCNCC